MLGSTIGSFLSWVIMPIVVVIIIIIVIVVAPIRQRTPVAMTHQSAINGALYCLIASGVPSSICWEVRMIRTCDVCRLQHWY